jgi:poly(3-hydroxyalkanoate) synthetase
LNDDWTRWIGQSLTRFAGPDANPPLPDLPVDRALVAGIAAYRRHPYVRDLQDPPAIWAEGSARMLDYGGDGQPVLLVPSLINRGYVLDLAQGLSLARFLSASGLRVLLLDWGWPGEAEREMGLDALITQRLAHAMAAVGMPMVLVGYCMGGLLTLAAAQLMPERVAGLALLATPWDFHAGPALPIGQPLERLEPLLAVGGRLPVDVLQALFSAGDPQGVGSKYRAFAKLDQASARARHFVALEDWLNDGIPLSTPVARDCLGGWYGENRPARGTWVIGGQVIDPSLLTMPAFIAIPERDRIVPPESATPLAGAIPHATVLRPAAGHVGMVAGSRAEGALWRGLTDWVHAVFGAHGSAGRQSAP